MKKLGWDETDAFVWTHNALEMRIDADWRALSEGGREETYAQNIRKKKTMHAIRESFKWSQWQKFWKTTKRHEVLTMIENGHGPTRYNQKRVAKARARAEDGLTRAIFTGGVRSPACF